MARFVQSKGARGSLKWIQLYVNQAPPRDLDSLILPSLGDSTSIDWVSPLATDDFAEYRDAAFLERIGIQHIAPGLAGFWPSRGPQWDALGNSDCGDVLLVEAKAHVDELCSPPSQGSADSLGMIDRSLQETASFIGAQARVSWSQVFYQLTNRISRIFISFERMASRLGLFLSISWVTMT